MDPNEIPAGTEIVLLRPPGFDDNSASLPFGAISIARFLESHGIRAHVFDGYNRATDIDQVLANVEAMKIPYVGLSVMSVQEANSHAICRRLQKNAPETKILLGGVHYTALPERGADYGTVIRGPGEQVVLDILQGRLKAEPGAVHVGQGLSDYGYDPLPSRETLARLGRKRNDRRFSVTTARGCPFKCKFCLCSSQRETKVTYYEIDDVVRMIVQAHELLGAEEIFILDDVFFLRPERVSAFCDAVDATGIPFRFQAFTHAKTRDGDMFRRAARSGFYEICIGVESGNEAILRQIGKNATVDEIEQTAQLVRDAGIEPHCLYMVGNPAETCETIHDTIRLAHRLHKTYGATSWFSIAQPFPGTEFLEEVPEYGQLLHADFTRYNNENVSFLPRGLTENQIFRWNRKGMIFGNRGLSAWPRYLLYLATGH